MICDHHADIVVHDTPDLRILRVQTCEKNDHDEVLDLKLHCDVEYVRMAS